MQPDKKKGFLDDVNRQKRFRIIFYASLVLLLIIDLVNWAVSHRHGHFAWEEIPFFNAMYGFTACVGLIFIAKILRWIVKRKEGYYD